MLRGLAGEGAGNVHCPQEHASLQLRKRGRREGRNLVGPVVVPVSNLGSTATDGMPLKAEFRSGYIYIYISVHIHINCSIPCWHARCRGRGPSSVQCWGLESVKFWFARQQGLRQVWHYPDLDSWQNSCPIPQNRGYRQYIYIYIVHHFGTAFCAHFIGFGQLCYLLLGSKYAAFQASFFFTLFPVFRRVEEFWHAESTW